MRLVDLNPRWVNDHDAPPDVRQGVSFNCPHCAGSATQTRLAIFFDPPIDDYPPADVSSKGHVARAAAGHLIDHHVGEILWKRTGETFDTLTLTPSVDASKFGHWHGFITNGEAG